LAPESALGSLPSVALSSAQAEPILLDLETVARKIGHVLHRPVCRSSPINDPDEAFSLRHHRLADYAIENVLASPAGKRVKTSVPSFRLMAGFGVAMNGRF
jgi:hypothetical protein